MADDARELIEFLFDTNSPQARTLVEELSAAGYEVPQRFGDASPSRVKPGKPEIALFDATMESLREAVSIFDRVNKAILDRGRLMRTLKLASAILAVVLSSGLAATLKDQPGWAFALALGTIAAAVMNLLVNALANDAKLAETYGETVAKHEEARLLAEQYARIDPVSLPRETVEARASQAADLVKYLRRQAVLWNVSLNTRS